MARLTGRRILVTGGASGIGRATAALFAREGATVAVLDRAADAAALVAGEIGGHGVAVDVADPASVDAAVDAAAAALGGLDGVVNAAGILSSSGIAETAPDVFARTLAVNLTGTFLVGTRGAAVPSGRAGGDDRQYRIGRWAAADRSRQHRLCRVEGWCDRNEQGDGVGTGAGNPRERGLPRPGGDRDDRRLPAQRGG